MISKNVIKKENELKIFTDGACRGNPGRASCSFIYIRNSDESPFLTFSEYLGVATNNIAEYEAIIRALNNAIKQTRWKVKIYCDSELVVNHLNGVYRVKAEHLKEKVEKIRQLINFFESVEFIHVPRENEFIQICDKLCNDALDKQGIKIN